MITFNPKFAIKRDTAVNPIAQTRYENAFGNIFSKVSPQLVIKPTAVFRHANVTVTARILSLIHIF